MLPTPAGSEPARQRSQPATPASSAASFRESVGRACAHSSGFPLCVQLFAGLPAGWSLYSPSYQCTPEARPQRPRCPRDRNPEYRSAQIRRLSPGGEYKLAQWLARPYGEFPLNQLVAAQRRRFALVAKGNDRSQRVILWNFEGLPCRLVVVDRKSVV